MTLSTSKGLQDLEREFPEWKPWLAVVAEVTRETSDGKWEPFAPSIDEPRLSKAPFLAGATLALDTTAIRRWSDRLFSVARNSGVCSQAQGKSAGNTALDPLALFDAALHLHAEQLRNLADQAGVNPDGFQAVAVLVPVPFLHACHRRWATTGNSDSWTEGYCPVCGAWPAFTEIRGIERTRHLRCGRCGSEWETSCLLCPFCGMSDHKELGALVPEKNSASYVIDVCKRCQGYVKSFTRLQAGPPDKIIMDDLATVDLDLAALEQGYKRPAGLGYALNSRLVAKPPSQRFFRWSL